MGGTSGEREVSLSTGRQILNALDPEKYTVYALDTASGQKFLPPGLTNAPATLTAGDGETAITSLPQLPTVGADNRPDVVFIALHGKGGEDGTVQGMLEILGIPYTGSGVLASALAMDKAMAKRVLTAAGVPMPRSVAVRMGDKTCLTLTEDALPLPWIVKPSNGGSTLGMTVVEDAEELGPSLATAFEYDDTVLVEQFITGTEITVPILGNDTLDVLPIVEIVPHSGFYDYAAKYTAGATDEIVPARLSEATARKARATALTCHKTLGCRGMSRTDMIVTSGGEIYTLEVNTIPGMTPTSLLPRAAEAAGIPFPRLLDRLIALALESR